MFSRSQDIVKAPVRTAAFTMLLQANCVIQEADPRALSRSWSVPHQAGPWRPPPRKGAARAHWGAGGGEEKGAIGRDLRARVSMYK